MEPEIQEIWKPVVGWEGLYEVSCIGRVRSIDKEVGMRTYGKITSKFIRGKLLSPQYDKDGYYVIHFRDTFNGRNSLLKVHRLVAEAFIPNPDKHDCIDHINGVRDDNRVENLRWCTNMQNANFPLAKINRSEAVRQSYINNPELRKLRAGTIGRNGCRPVIVYKDGVEIGKFNAIIDFCREYDLQPSYFYNEIRRSGIYKGYTIKRIEVC